MLKRKESDDIVLKGCVKDHKNLRLVPKDTCIFSTEEILTIRFALDKSWLQEDVFKDKFDHPVIIYKGPNSLSAGLTCKECKGTLIEKNEAKIKGAPTENWREVIELW